MLGHWTLDGDPESGCQSPSPHDSRTASHAFSYFTRGLLRFAKRPSTVNAASGDVSFCRWQLSSGEARLPLDRIKKPHYGDEDWRENPIPASRVVWHWKVETTQSACAEGVHICRVSQNLKKFRQMHDCKCFLRAAHWNAHPSERVT